MFTDNTLVQVVSVIHMSNDSYHHQNYVLLYAYSLQLFQRKEKKSCQSQTPPEVIACNNFLTDYLFALTFFL